MRESQNVSGLPIHGVCVKDECRLESKREESISDKGVQHVVFINISYYGHYVLVSQSDT